MCKLGGRDHNATSYSTETREMGPGTGAAVFAEIITLRAIALKLGSNFKVAALSVAEIITLRAIALKLKSYSVF